MNSHLTRIVFTALALVGFAGAAQAALVAETYVDNCDADGCDGSKLYLSVDDDGGSGNWIITYSIDTTGYSDTMLGINQVGFKVIKDWDLGAVGTEVTSYPAGSITDWNPIYDDPISSSIKGPCMTTPGGNTDKVCATGFVNIQTDGVYTWQFYIVGGTLIEDPDEWHLGAQYANGGGRSTGQIISTSGVGGTVPVPEPTAAVLFGLGAVLVARRTRRS